MQYIWAVGTSFRPLAHGTFRSRIKAVAYIQSLASGGAGGKEDQETLVNGGHEEEHDLKAGGGGGKEGQQSLVNGGHEEDNVLEAGATLSEVQAHVANHWLREEGGEEEELVCRPSVLIKSGVAADLEALRAFQAVPENGVDGDVSMEDCEREEEEETIGENSSLNTRDTTGILIFCY
jgi:hypothetical protein